MWGGGVPPPKPPSVEPPPRNKRNKVVDTELEALRQKGLAKLLNRHFTSVTKAISEERAAAEEALRDLETRKANTSEFTISKGGYSFYDQQVKDLQQKKAGVKRKERETLLLYQRYVDKFGGTGAVAVPNTSEFNKSDSKSSRKTKKTGKKAAATKTDSTEDCSQKNASLGGDKIPSVGSAGLIETKHQKRVSDEHDLSDNNKRELEKNIIDGDSYTPLITTHGIEPGSTLQSTLFSQSVTIDSGAQLKMLKEEKMLLSHTNLNKLAASIPTVESEAEILAISEGETINQDADLHVSPEQVILKVSASEDLSTTIAYEESEDEKSNVSGLTTSASLALSDAESRLYEFIRTETEAVRQILSEEENSVSTGVISSRDQYSVASSFGNESTIAAKKAELMVQQMQDMMNEYKATSIKSESTLGPEKPDFESYELNSPNPDENWTVLWCDNHKREYYHEKNSGKTQWEKPQVADTDAKWERQATAKSEDDDFVPLTDYTHTKKHPSNLMKYYESEEAAMKRRPTRRELYRQRQRKLRNRRRIIAVMAFITICCVTAFYCYKRQQTDPAFADFLGAVIGKKNGRQINDIVFQGSEEKGNMVSSKKVENVKLTDHPKVKLEALKKQRIMEQEQLTAGKTKDKSFSWREDFTRLGKEEEEGHKAVESKERKHQTKEEKAQFAKLELEKEEEQDWNAMVQRKKVERQQEDQIRTLKLQHKEVKHHHQLEEEKVYIAKTKREEAEKQRQEKEQKARATKTKREEAERQRQIELGRARVTKIQQEAERRRKGEEYKAGGLEVTREEFETRTQRTEIKNNEIQTKEKRMDVLERERKLEDAKWKEIERQAKEERAEIAKIQREEAKVLAKEKKDRIKKEREERQNRRKVEVREKDSNKLALSRPWRCNLPLFYLVNKTCRQLSTANPMYDLASLVDAMMQ